MRRGAIRHPPLALTNERGHALLLALVAASLLVSIGSALVVGSGSETLIAAHHRDTAQLRFSADAALERALVDLAGAPDWGLAGAGLMSAMGAGAPPPVQAVGGTLVPLAMDAAALASPAPGPWLPFAWGTMGDLFGSTGDPPVFVMVWVSAGGNPDPDAAWLVSRAYGPGSASAGVAVRAVRGAGGRPRVVTWHEVR